MHSIDWQESLHTRTFPSLWLGTYYATNKFLFPSAPVRCLNNWLSKHFVSHNPSAHKRTRVHKVQILLFLSDMVDFYFVGSRQFFSSTGSIFLSTKNMVKCIINL